MSYLCAGLKLSPTWPPGQSEDIVLGDGCGLYDVDGAVGWVGRGMMECGMEVCLVPAKMWGMR